jgi:hypothetical protein
MRKKYIPYVTSIVFFTAATLGITLLGALIYGAVAGIRGGTGLFQSPLFYRTAADALFFEGSTILTFGALVEFFLRGFSDTVARRLMLPYTLARRMPPRGDAPEEPQNPYAGGWMLIFSGALLFIASLAFAFISMK